MAKEKAAPPLVQSGIFKKAINEQAYLKAGLLGFPGSGKTFTSYLLALGIIESLNGKATTPLLFLDSETGSDFLVSLAEKDGVNLMVAKSRAFTDLLSAVDEAEKLGAVLIIDSITHFWTELMAAYMKEKKRTRLYFQDWGPIKANWGVFSTKYINSKCHIIMCGRAGYEYEYTTDETGEKKLEKSGTKMKVESDMGYEPSLLIEMVREPQSNEIAAGSAAGKKKVEGRLWNHVAYVLKDRTRTLEGQRFENPDFTQFAPAVEFLNLGGKHMGVDSTRDSSSLFANDQERAMHKRITSLKVTLEEIQGLLVSEIPGLSASEKAEKATLIYECFGTRSWTAVENMKLEDLIKGHGRLEQRLIARKKQAEQPMKAGA